MSEQWLFLPLVERPEYQNECISLLNNEWSRSVTQRETSMKRTSNRSPPMSLILLEAQTERLVGYAKLCNMPSSETECWVESVIIQPDLRSQGIGRVLMRNIETIAKSFGFKKIFLSTEDKEAFYRKCGYVPCPPVLNFGANAGLFAKGNLNNLLNSSQKSPTSSFKRNDPSHVPLNNNVPPPPPAPPLPPALKVQKVSSNPPKIYMCKEI